MEWLLNLIVEIVFPFGPKGIDDKNHSAEPRPRNLLHQKCHNRVLSPESTTLCFRAQTPGSWNPKLPIGPKVVPFWGSYLEFYKIIPKRNYFDLGPMGMDLGLRGLGVKGLGFS